MFKLLVFDVDRTLLNSANEIPIGVLNDIQKLREHGFLITIATGRAIPDLYGILEQFHCDVPFITSSGACINDCNNWDILMHFPIAAGIKAQVINVAYAHPNLGIVLQYYDCCISDEKGYQTWQAWYGDSTTTMQSTNLQKAVVPDPLKIDLLGEKDHLECLEADLMSKNLSVEISRSGFNSLEITARGVTKGFGLEKLSIYLQMPLDQIVVFGDSLNDLPMFVIAGYAVSIGSSDDSLNAHVDLVAPDCDENGVSWAVRKIFWDVFN